MPGIDTFGLFVVPPDVFPPMPIIAISALAVIGGIIGAVSFSGSAIAFAKLQGLIKGSLRFGGQKYLTLVVLLAVNPPAPPPPSGR